jgi:magnesium transporter
MQPTAATPLHAEVPPLHGRSNPADVADLIATVEDDQVAACFRALEPEQRVDVFEHLGQHDRERLVQALGQPELAQVLHGMCSDDRAAFFRHLPEPSRLALLPLLTPAEQEDVAHLMAFPEESAGALMSTEFAAVPPDIPVERAIEELRALAPRRETIYTVYVVDSERRLLGAVSLVDLITAPAGSLVREVMDPDVVALPADADREEVARTIAKYDLMAVPIVDPERRLLGIVTEDDALDVIELEKSEDAQLASGIAPDPAGTPYSQTPARLLVRRRVVWLLVLLLTALVTARVVAAFEATLASVVALAFFIPVVTGSGGNTGTQSATLMIQALATGDVSVGDWARVFIKELLIGAALGAVLATVIYLIGLAWPDARQVAPVVGATMVAVIIWANLLGALLPLLLRRLGIDPAVAGAPVVSTVVDASGLLIYFGVARLLL